MIHHTRHTNNINIKISVTSTSKTNMFHTCDNISENFARISDTYARVNTRAAILSDTLDKIDTLLVQYKNQAQSNRSSCVPGMYTPVPPLTSASANVYGGSGHGPHLVRAIRCKRYVK